MLGNALGVPTSHELLSHVSSQWELYVFVKSQHTETFVSAVLPNTNNSIVERTRLSAMLQTATLPYSLLSTWLLHALTPESSQISFPNDSIALYR